MKAPRSRRALFDILEGAVSMRAIQMIDDEWRIVGKYCYATPTADGWDLWLCDTADLGRGLSGRKLHSILETLAQEASFTIGDDEAWATLPGPQLILENLDLLRIRRKRRVPDSVLATLLAHRFGSVHLHGAV